MWIMNITVIDLWGHPVTLLYAVTVLSRRMLDDEQIAAERVPKDPYRTSTLGVRFRF